MTLKEILETKLQEGWVVKFCMNSMRIKMCSITKGDLLSRTSFEGRYTPDGNGAGPTAQSALVAALQSFNTGYKRTEYSTGDTETYSMLEKFIHSGYNVFLWLDSGLLILQIRHNTFCRIPAKVLLEVQRSKQLITWKDNKNRLCQTIPSSVDIMKNVNFPHLDTYRTKTDGTGQWEDSEHHHLFTEFRCDTNLLLDLSRQKLLTAPRLTE